MNAHAKEGLHDRCERVERKAHGAQRPRHNNELGEGASTAQRSDPFAQQVVQTFPKRFNQKLADWLVFYNSQRPHHSLSQTSLSFLLKHQPECQRWLDLYIMFTGQSRAPIICGSSGRSAAW